MISVQKHQSKASFRDFPKQSVGKYPESPPLKQEIPGLRSAIATPGAGHLLRNDGKKHANHILIMFLPYMVAKYTNSDHLPR